MTDPLTCSESSRQSNEQIFATASRADYWLLLEYDGPLGPKALPDSKLPSAVIAFLEEQAEILGNCRIQLIKRGGRRDAGGAAFFVAVNHEEQPNLYEFHLNAYVDLLDMDLQAIAAEDLAYRPHDRTEPLFLVCTNGTRDPCCARLGLPLYRKMREKYPEQVWQVSHVGGHRFAPNLVALPHGSYYGYVSEGDAESIVQAHNSGQLFLPAYRGRSCYEKDVQAAETLLRQALDLRDLYLFKLIEIEGISENESLMHFSDLRNGKTYCVQLYREIKEIEVLKSCRDDGPRRTDFYRLVDFSTHREVQRI